MPVSHCFANSLQYQYVLTFSPFSCWWKISHKCNLF